MCKTISSYTTGKVISLENIKPEIYKLTLQTTLTNEDKSLPQDGQFYMLRSSVSKVLLSRPISVFHSEKQANNTVLVDFLILKKGKGTEELCSLLPSQSVEMVGPLGNAFPKPENSDFDSINPKIAIIGGGIGVAPVAGFANHLPQYSYDFFACFKSFSYGLENIQPKNLFITTDNGSEGTKGMLNAVFNEDKLKKANYSLIFACGPEPMLTYVQKIATENNIQCYLSLESKMACGVGACLGCTITTTDGNKRCCKDGPVFDAQKVIFQKPKVNTNTTIKNDTTIDLSVNICGVKLQNPVIAASGTFGFGSEYQSLMDVNALGGICSKGLTLEPKPGNTGIRLSETPSGLINSIGLENPGIKAFISNQLPKMLALKPISIANLSGSSTETYIEGAKLLDKTDVPLIELNISCPNVKAGGMAFGLDPQTACDITKEVKKATSKPIIVKLSPNAPSITEIALAVISGGADAVSLVNTFQATAINVEKEQFVFDNIKAGLAGPAIKPIALRMVYDVALAISKLPQDQQVPVIALGGIQTWQDAVEFLLAGASAIQVGTSTFSEPDCMIKIIDGIKNWMQRKNYTSINQFSGKMLRFAN